MCKTYNKIGSLTTLKLRLQSNNIHDFKSLKEVIDFQKSYMIFRQQLISDHENLIEQEKLMLNIDLPNLEVAIETQRQQSVQRLTNEIDKLKQQLNISLGKASANFFRKLVSSLRLVNYKRKSNRYQFITSNFNGAVKQRVEYPSFKVKCCSELSNTEEITLTEKTILKINIYGTYQSTH